MAYTCNKTFWCNYVKIPTKDNRDRDIIIIINKTENFMVNRLLQYKTKRVSVILRETYIPPERLYKENSTSRQRSGKGAIRKRFPLQKPTGTNTMKHIMSRMSRYFPPISPIGGYSVTLECFLCTEQIKNGGHQV